MGDSLFAPMKFEHTSLDQLEGFISDPSWAIEQKMDGTRALVKITDQGITFLTHGGRALKHTAATQWFDSLRKSLAAVQRLVKPGERCFLDGEILCETGELYIFDAPEINLGGKIVCVPGHTLQLRRKIMDMLFGCPLLGGRPNIRLAYQARSREEKEMLVRSVMDAGAEGVMVKRLDSSYEQGKRVLHSLKVKVTRTADVVVTKRNTGGACNAILAVTGDDGELVNVGACTMIGKPDAQPGDVIEVEYLYKIEALYQPRMVRIRDDKRPEECGLDQFVTYSKEILA